MENSQHNEEQSIRWMLHFFTIGVVGWALRRFPYTTNLFRYTFVQPSPLV